DADLFDRGLMSGWSLHGAIFVQSADFKKCGVIICARGVFRVCFWQSGRLRIFRINLNAFQ
ncbi:MAG: hypothetical protein ACK5ZY_15085, partial [Cyclobacteriaceae bacterium]